MTKALVKSFEASPLPVRCGAFIARKSWVIAGCDDMHVRVGVLRVLCLWMLLCVSR